MQNYFNYLPPEIPPMIFAEVDSLSFIKCSRLLCRKFDIQKSADVWNRIVEKELVQKGYRSKVFGIEECRKLFGYQMEKYASNICFELDLPSPFFPGMTVGESSHVTLIPPHMTREKIEEIAKKYLQKGFTPWSLKPTFEVSPTGYFIITTDQFIPGDLEEASDPTSSYPTYREPDVGEISIDLIVRCISTNERLLSQDPAVYTRCSSKKIMVGGYLDNGLSIVSAPPRAQPSIGLLAVKTLLS